jgi:hypothetical protein
MKKTMIAALCAAQLGAIPAVAADLPSDRIGASSRFGAFAGARLRVPLGKAREHKVRAGFTLAPVVVTLRQADGKARTRFAEGVEMGFDAGKARLSLGGQPASRRAPAGRKLGISATEGLAIGVGVVALVVGGLYLWADSSCGEDCN